MISYFLLLRLKISFRSLIELGTLRIIQAFVFTPFVIIALYKNTQSITGAIFLLIINSYIIFQVQLIRHDKLFLKMLFRNRPILYFFEYFIYSIPAITLLIINGHYLFAVSILPVNFLIGLLNIKPLKGYPSGKKKRWFPVTLYEWNSGVRQNLLLIIGFYALAIILYRFELGILVVILLSSVFYAFFYVECESRKFLELFELSPGKFLIRKISLALLSFLAVDSLLILAFAVLHPGYILFLAIVLIFSSVIIANAIIVKYAFYSEGDMLTVYSGVLVSLNVFFIVSIVTIHVYLLPVPIVLNLWLIKKAKENLNQYLYAYH